MGIMNRLARKEQKPSQDATKPQDLLQTPANGNAAVTATPDAISPEVMEQQKVTMLACLLGAVASLGGFIFGYVSYLGPGLCDALLRTRSNKNPPLQQSIRH
ncbi:hypothetical protein Golomagni_08079 [Golovinomyces magnicellulatus]|nr:hypothetical protein Golomagni_08079 [Golovinomyces magnicellulatus]